VDLDLIRRRVARYEAQRAELVNQRSLAGTGARNLADVALRVSYLDGKIDALTDVLEVADGKDQQ
jgi:hypothetical protein